MGKNKKDVVKKLDKENKKISPNDNERAKKQHWYTANEVNKLIGIFLVVVAVIAVFYGLTVLIKSHASNDRVSKDTGVAVIQYDKILVGQILNQNKTAYYVLATYEDDGSKELYQFYIDGYTASEDALKIYSVDLSDSFNKQYIGDNSNFSFSDLKDIRFNKATLLKIENKQITEHYEGKDAIVEYLKKL